MKNNKKIYIALGIFPLIAFLLVYNFNRNDSYHKPNFTGTVTEIFDKTIMVSVDEGEGEEELNSSDKIIVSLDVKSKDSKTHFTVGDRVNVFYDGVIAESYPAQINTVYEILLVNE